MSLKQLTLVVLFAAVIPWNTMLPHAFAQRSSVPRKELLLASSVAKDIDSHFALLPREEDQEPGNAIPVLLRIIYEQQYFMRDLYPKLHEYAEMDLKDPRWKDFYFDRFAEQIQRAGSMSFADWQYPIRKNRPYAILLPDIQSQRQLVGSGMTAWIRLRLSQGDNFSALNGIRAQIACGRHCAATPVAVCHIVGVAIANTGLDNLELTMQSKDSPNMYWSLACLPPTLHDLGPMVRWELWASPARLPEQTPPIGDDGWRAIAKEFLECFQELSNITNDSYTREEGDRLQKNMDRIAKEELTQSLRFSEEDVAKMSGEERIMRWLDMQYRRFRTVVEPLSYQSPKQVIAAKKKLEQVNKDLLARTGAKSSPFAIALPDGILASRIFERRIKFLQTVESLRHHASKHDGTFPEKLEELELPAPNDPFTEMPFLYEAAGKKARLYQSEIDGFVVSTYDYDLTIR